MYRLIVADPPWDYRNHTDAKNGAACSAMTTMSTEALCALPVREMATEDAILLLWSTNPKLPDALRVVEAWGFDYCTKTTWIKTCQNQPLRVRRGTGFWFGGATEDLILARRKGTKRPEGFVGPLGLGQRGEADAFVGADFFLSPIERPHSRKPPGLLEWGLSFPGPRCELFARRETPGYDCYGYETGWSLTKSGIGEKL